MVSRVVEHAPACQVRSFSTGFRLSALPLVGGIAIHGTTGLDLACITVVILVVVVVAPAVWSRKAYRRRAGREVLRTILRWDW
jgi:hypothetical protein